MVLAVLGFVWSCRQTGSRSAGPSGKEAQEGGPESGRAALAADKIHDETAAFLAGLAVKDSILKDLQMKGEWKRFSQTMDVRWQTLTHDRLIPMKEWAAKELAEPSGTENLIFYPFGGPDFLTVFSLFPKAGTYVLLGLERCGELPEFGGRPFADIWTYLDDVGLSLEDFFKRSYFITKNMIESLQENKVDGVLPLICFFLKRSGQIIVSLKHLELDDTGNLIESPYEVGPRQGKRPNGIRIDFHASGSRLIKTVRYFSVDLVNERMGPESKFYAYLDKLGRLTTFIKSGSYLLHYDNFSNIRNLILAKSRFILQDDTGVPYRFFKNTDWLVTLYGHYGKPVEDFKGVDQPDLRAAYEDPSRIRPLPFSLGYHWGSHLNSFLLAKRIE